MTQGNGHARRLDSAADLFAKTQGHGGPTPAAYFRWKSVVSRAVAAVLLVPGLPLLLTLGLLVRLTSRGPAIYRQIRVGHRGKHFLMYKLRTMRQNAESDTGPVWTQENDPRITKVGRVLRALHLDELPQIFNVLRGEMDLFGPRPERPEFIRALVSQIPEYANRLAVRPGVSGLAQINLPPDTDLNSVRRKLALDLEYIEHANLLLDVRMFVCTGMRMLGLWGGRAVQLMRLERSPELDSHLPEPRNARGQHVGPETIVRANKAIKEESVPTSFWPRVQKLGDSVKRASAPLVDRSPEV